MGATVSGDTKASDDAGRLDDKDFEFVSQEDAMWASMRGTSASSAESLESLESNGKRRKKHRGRRRNEASRRARASLAQGEVNDPLGGEEALALNLEEREPGEEEQGASIRRFYSCLEGTSAGTSPDRERKELAEDTQGVIGRFKTCTDLEAETEEKSRATSPLKWIARGSIWSKSPEGSESSPRATAEPENLSIATIRTEEPASALGDAKPEHTPEPETDVDANDSNRLGGVAAGLKVSTEAVLANAQAMGTELRARATELAADPEVRFVAKAAGGGAAVVGVTGGTVGLTAGTVVGALIGVVPAIFTFGLSIPIGAAIGGGTGVAVGTAVGSTVGFLGGAAGGTAYTKRSQIATKANDLWEQLATPH